MGRTVLHQQLPRFVAPMLAKAGRPFDSDEYLFEIKWDGTRMLAYVDRAGYRLVNRHGHDRTEQYPEFAFLKQCPPGIILDGEVVVLVAGKPDFSKLLAREQTRTLLKIRMLTQALPATYVAFDLLYTGYEPLLDQPLQRRRAKLRKLLEDRGTARMVLSEGVVGEGRAFFEEICREGLEGVVAKRLDSRYLTGRRTSAWIKDARCSAAASA
jgi:ATP-dependent DNA ligase